MPRPTNLSSSMRVWLRTGGLVVGTIAAIVVAGMAIRWTAGHYAQVRELRMRVAQAQNFQQTEAARTQAMAQARREAEALQLDVSRGKGMANMLDHLQAEAQRWHVQMNAVQSSDRPAQPVSWGPRLSFQPIPITLTVVGRYRAIGEFLGGLARAPFVAEVQRVAMKRHPDRYPQLEAHVTLVVYGIVP